MTRRRPLPGPTALQAWLLAALLLVAQGLGLAHRVAHAPGLGHGGATLAAVSTSAKGHADGQAKASWAAGHEADSAECRLIDQLAHGDGLCSTPWAAAAAPQAGETRAAAPAPAPRAGSASAYFARAPPQA